MRDKSKTYFSNLPNNTNNEYDLIGKYESCVKKIKIKHILCGSEFEMTPNDFINGHRCPICAKKARAKKSKYNIDKYKKEINEKYGDEYTILSESLTKLSDQITIRHNKCGFEYTSMARNLLKRNMGCRKCALEKSVKIMHSAPKKEGPEKTTQEFLEELKNIYPNFNDYEVLGEYKGSKTPIEMRHKICGTIFFPTPNNLLAHKTECPKCMSCQTKSKEEKDVLEFIKTFYDGKIEENIRFDNSYELDIYIPDLKIGIEYDGLYWHSDKKVSKIYHLDKLNFFNDKNIRLITLFEDEWIYKKDIVKDKIKNILGFNSRKIYARNCKIITPTAKEKNIFLDKYHIQGHDTSNYYFGLEFNGELVAVMTFSKLRSILGNKIKDSTIIELSRYASSINIVGGFSKLLKHAILSFNNNIKTIKTYADLRWSSKESNVYLSNNFKLVSISKPNYFYCLDNKRYYRYNFRKQNLKKKFPKFFDRNLTEFQIMDKTKYFRIWDCGNLVYEYTIK